jgi:hypothetical protein
MVVLLSGFRNLCPQFRGVDRKNFWYCAHVLIVAPSATTFQFEPSEQATVAAPEFPSVT